MVRVRVRRNATEKDFKFLGKSMALKRALVCVTANGLLGGGLAGGLSLLGQKHSLDVGQHTTLGDGHTRQKLVQLLVVADGQLKVTGDDSRLLVVTGSVSCQLQHLSSQVLEHCRQVHGGSGANTLSIVALAQQTVDTTHGELKSGTGRAGLALSLDFSSFTTSRHD
jgi:hypothetical protein